MPTARDFFREDDGRGVGGGGGRGSGSIPGRSQEAEDVQVVRYFKLLNRCSQKYVRLTSKHIDSKAMLDSIYSTSYISSSIFELHLIYSWVYTVYLLYQVMFHIGLQLVYFLAVDGGPVVSMVDCQTRSSGFKSRPGQKFGSRIIEISAPRTCMRP